VSPKVQMYDGCKPLQPSPSADPFARFAPGDPNFIPQSSFTFNDLRKRDKLYTRQALLEIVLGEKQAKQYFHSEQSLKDKAYWISTFERDLRKNLRWGHTLLQTTQLGIRIMKPTISFSPTNDVLPVPYDYIDSQKGFVCEQILEPFKQWIKQLKTLDSPDLLNLRISHTPLTKLIHSGSALYIIIREPRFPAWPKLIESTDNTLQDNVICINRRSKSITFQGTEIVLPERLYQLALLVCESGQKGISAKDYENHCQAFDNVSPDLAKEISRLNTEIEKALQVEYTKPDKWFIKSKGKQTPYYLHHQYSFQPETGSL
jgi:hypothetical protein